MRNPDEQRREMLAAANDLIVGSGYEGMSLDAVCAAAGCSKSAVYAHFGNKDGLMKALVEAAAATFAQCLHALYLPGPGLRPALEGYANQVLERALARDHVAVLRAALAAGAQRDGPGQVYADIGVSSTRAALAQFLAAKTASGELSVGDCESAADQFHGLLLGWPLLQALLADTPSATANKRNAAARSAVSVFLAAYGPPPAGPDA